MTNPQPHTGSYYAATANQNTEYPPLVGEQHADVCVIGAGFTGISMALHLAERGYNVHVVEASKVGWGASGRNGGQMIGGIFGEERLAAAHDVGTQKKIWEIRWACFITSYGTGYRRIEPTGTARMTLAILTEL